MAGAPTRTDLLLSSCCFSAVGRISAFQFIISGFTVAIVLVILVAGYLPVGASSPGAGQSSRRDVFGDPQHVRATRFGGFAIRSSTGGSLIFDYGARLLGRSSAASSTSPNTSTSASNASGSRTPPKSVIKTKLEMVATWERSHYQVCHSFDIRRKPKLSHSLPFLSRHPSYTSRSLSSLSVRLGVSLRLTQNFIVHINVQRIRPTKDQRLPTRSASTATTEEIYST